MGAVWKFIAKPANRQILAWIGGGIVAVAIGAWTVVTYVWPPAHGPASSDCIEQAIAIGGNVSGSTVTNNVTGSQNSGSCGLAKK